MAKPIKPEQLFKVYQKKVSFIDDYLGTFDGELIQLEKDLAMLIVGEYLPKFVTKDGYIVLSEKNASIMSQLDKVMDDFKATFAESVFKGTAESMLKLTGLTSEYFRIQNFGAKTITNIQDKLSKMQFTIGINPKGEVIAGSFIDNLATTPQARSLFADYIRKGIEGEVKYSDFVSGFKDLISGTDEVKGSLTRYAGAYVHDSFFTHSRAVDKFFADELGIDCFYYAGHEVRDSRDFCLARKGKIFTREEIESWNNLDWAGKIPNEDIFTQLGGYGCIDNLMPIACDSVTEKELSEADPFE